MAKKMKKAAKPFKSEHTKAGPNMMPHTGKADCRCPNCKDKRKG